MKPNTVNVAQPLQAAQDKTATWLRIPRELRERPQWCYTLPTDPDPRRRKAPRRANNVLADPTNPAEWMPFDLACQWAVHVGGEVGYVLTADDPFACIDLDVKEHTTPTQMANYQAIVNDFSTYSEFSRSGLGMHVWARGKIGSGCRFDGVEVYSQERFIICTGNVYAALPITDRQELLNKLLGKIRGSLGSKPAAIPDGPAVIDDQGILAKASTATNAGKFNQLWAGDWKAMGYPSQSEADIALMSMIAFYSPNNEQCRRLFQQSELFRHWPTKKQTRADYLLNRVLLIVRARDNQQKAVEHGKQLAERILLTWDRKDDEWLVNISDVLTRGSPPPEFLTAQLLPAKQATLLSADGGSGKTRLSLAWAAHAAVGRPFLGKANTQGPVVFYSAEDDEDVMRNLLARICEHFNLDPAEVARNLYLIDASDLESAVLFKEVKRGELGTTREYDRLQRCINKARARYVFIDNASEVFEGDEIKRQQTKAFIRALRMLARPHKSAVVLLAHVNRETAKGATQNGQEYSGNTQWNNSVRSRLYLGPATDEDPSIKLWHRKSNYGKKADPIDLAWTESGLLESITSEEAAALAETRDTEQMRQLVDVIRATVSTGVDIPHADTGSKTTYSVLKGQPFFPLGLSKKRHDKLIAMALEAGTLKVDEYKKHRKPAWRLLPVGT